MSMFIVRLGERSSQPLLGRILKFSTTRASSSTISEKPEEEFRVLELIPKKIEIKKEVIKKFPVPPPRINQMQVDQDWPSVWPGPRTFHPGVVPLPVRQGYPKKREGPPSKWANTELMKIPNFLHLTPPAIKRHCEALKQFCTSWPEGLETDEKCEQHFPLEIIATDYCYSGPTIREPRARIVTFRTKLSSLDLNTHAKDKLLRLVKDRYNPETDWITITADRCPTRKQNWEYLEYLLTALYCESWKVEDWEAEKAEADMEYYDWDASKSRQTLVTIRAWPNVPTDSDYDSIPHAVEYKVALSDLINNGEDEHSINKYKEAVKNLLNLNPPKEKF
ncbi:28S ribosomal protein S35, mitochondrial [Orussus abietinus]|uniref:28S ribosomal protein S35, mitochondrial n=1 Tax=Orussus abietinus TaxID=222816 RepID=UPI00062692EF|nr:28S ribosomal protein S35, mitochondrial [Orussus abietinus]